MKKDKLLSLLEQVEDYSILLIRNCIDLPYHNLGHTQTVVKWVYSLSIEEHIPDHMCHLLIIAAWFHDTGFAIHYEEHERSSADIMQEFLMYHLSQEEIQFVSECILATRVKLQPENIYQSILRDADMSHLGSNDYGYWQHLLRMEWKQIYNKSYTDLEWDTINMEFLSNHNYHTTSAGKMFNCIKTTNIKKLDLQLNSCY